MSLTGTSRRVPPTVQILPRRCGSSDLPIPARHLTTDEIVQSRRRNGFLKQRARFGFPMRHVLRQEVGRKVAELLTDAGEETFLIDTQSGPGINLVGNVLDTQILKRAGVENVQAVILALNADSTTLFATVIVKDLAPDVPVIARVNRAENVERIYAAGADFALSISQVSGQLLAWRLLGKESVAVDPELRVIKVSTHGLESYHPNQSEIRVKTGCSVVAVERGDELLVEFGPGFRFEPKDAVYICGSAEAAQKFDDIFPQE